jgi:hypothetical protein
MSSTRFLVCGLISGLSLKTRDTVGFDTFANLAMSSIEVSFCFRGGMKGIHRIRLQMQSVARRGALEDCGLATNPCR